MNIKKITAAVMAVTILAGMTACSDTVNETAEVSETTTVVEETTTTAEETTTVTEETTTAETTTASETTTVTEVFTEPSDFLVDTVFYKKDDPEDYIAICKKLNELMYELWDIEFPDINDYESYEDYIAAYEDYMSVYDKCMEAYEEYQELREKYYGYEDYEDYESGEEPEEVITEIDDEEYKEACEEYDRLVNEFRAVPTPYPENYSTYDEYLKAYGELESMYNACAEANKKCRSLYDKFIDELKYQSGVEVEVTHYVHDIDMPKMYKPVEDRKTRGEYFTYDKPIMFDLDSDGTEEKIEVYPDPDKYYILNLTINGKTIEAGVDSDGDFLVKEILICDIDESDKFYEIAICGGMFHRYISTSFFRYENGELYNIGQVRDCIDGNYEYPSHLIDSLGESLRINGNGTISAAKSLDIFQSWMAYATYKYDSETKKLVDITDIYYPYGKELMNDYEAVSRKIYVDEWEPSYTSRTVNLYSENDRNSKTVEFKPQKFVATATDNKNWVYLVGESGVSGWLYYEDNNTYDENGKVITGGDNAFIDAVTGERYVEWGNEEVVGYMDVFCNLLMYD